MTKAYEHAVSRHLEDSSPNLFINGDFSVWQRGSNHDNETNTFTYHADRWITSFAGTSCNIYRGDASFIPENFGGTRNNIAVDNAVGLSSFEHLQRIESYNCAELVSGTKVTVSFKVWCSDSNPVTVGTRMWRANDYDDWTAQHDLVSSDNISVDHNGIASFTMTVPNEYYHYGCQVGLTVYDSVDTRTIAITDAKFEVGEFATPFIADDISTNLNKCQRYYSIGRARFYSPTHVAGQIIGGTVHYPAPLRIAPSVILTGWEGSGGNFSTSPILEESNIFGFFAYSRASNTSETAGTLSWASDAEL